MEPGEIHCVVSKRKPSRFLALFIEPDHFRNFAERSGVSGAPHFCFADTTSPRLLHALKCLSRSFQAGRNALKLQSQLTVLLQQALQFTESQPHACEARGPGLRRSLECAKELLEQRENESIGLDELAAASALSRFYLVRSFTEQFGLPPHAYQIHVRIKHACRLLRGDMPCVQVATAVGFADQSHFNRHFKKIMGVTPSAYAHSPITSAHLAV
jgi:AraC-like DNA-binding protein